MVYHPHCNFDHSTILCSPAKSKDNEHSQSEISLNRTQEDIIKTDFKDYDGTSTAAYEYSLKITADVGFSLLQENGELKTKWNDVNKMKWCKQTFYEESDGE